MLQRDRDLLRIGLLALLRLLPAVSLAEVGDLTHESWPQWRGPDRNGQAVGEWPDDLAGLERLWRVELGKGYPGPIVTPGRVFVAATKDGVTEVVRALDRKTGRTLWSAEWPGEGSVPFFAARNGDWIRSTPAWDGEALYVGGMNEVLVKLDAETGEKLWRVDFPQRYSTNVPSFGLSSSPLLDGDHLYIQAANSIIKLDKADGQTLWRSLALSDDIMVNGAFSSPVLATIAGERQLLVQTRLELHGVDPRNGSVLWSREVPHFRGMNILTPTVYSDAEFGDAVFTSSYRNRSHLFRVAPRGIGFGVDEIWTHKVQGYMSSPVIVEGHVYLHLGNGRLTCLDVETGESRWTTTPMGDYWSMITDGGRILALNESGHLRLIRADAERFVLLDERRVADAETWGHLAISGRELFVRELEAISAWRWRNATDPAAATSGR